jgi:hypothetical protein
VQYETDRGLQKERSLGRKDAIEEPRMEQVIAQSAQGEDVKGHCDEHVDAQPADNIFQSMRSNKKPRETWTDMVGMTVQVRNFERKEAIYSQGEPGNTVMYIKKKAE